MPLRETDPLDLVRPGFKEEEGEVKKDKIKNLNSLQNVPPSQFNQRVLLRLLLIYIIVARPNSLAHLYRPPRVNGAAKHQTQSSEKSPWTGN